MAVIERFATDQVTPGEQLPYWNRLAEETFSGLTVDSDAGPFAAEMLRWTLGNLTMIRPRSPAAIVRSQAAATRGRSDLVILHLQHRGRSRSRQFRSEIELASGDLALCASDADYSLELSGMNDMLVVEMPRAALTARLPDLDARIARHVSGATPGARMLHDFVLSLWRQGSQSAADPAWQSGMAAVFLDLVCLALRGADALPAPPSRPDQRMLALVEARLDDPDLRTSTLAEALNLSARSVQNMFAAMGATPSGYILERRLDCAADRLAADRTASITATAFDLGFNDSAYFARCFRQRFGTSPSLYRARC